MKKSFQKKIEASEKTKEKKNPFIKIKRVTKKLRCRPFLKKRRTSKGNWKVKQNRTLKQLPFTKASKRRKNLKKEKFVWRQNVKN